VAVEREEAALRFSDPEGLAHELAVVDTDEEPLVAAVPGIPAEHGLQGFDGVRAYARDPQASTALLRDALCFEDEGDGAWRIAGERRSARYRYDEPPGPAVEGAGSVHHIAWATRDDEQEAWRRRVASAGAPVTAVIDRQYFRSIYFREPSGVLFEIATLSPGFAIDEDPERLGEALRLPPQHEHLREHLERSLTPLQSPRAAAARP
jgi:glyoxalase family protein